MFSQFHNLLQLLPRALRGSRGGLPMRQHFVMRQHAVNASRWHALLGGLISGVLTCSAQALTVPDFSNTANIAASSEQFEPGLGNNSSSVQVLPKGMQVTKTADASGLSTPAVAGELINYTIQVTNTGLLGLTNVQLADSIIASTDLALVSGDSNVDGVLDAGEVWEYAGSYAITQADLDSNGGGDADIDNTVTVTSNELPAMDAIAEVPIQQLPAFTVEKVVDATAIATPTTLNYTITVTNTGNITLTNPVLSDVLPDSSAGTLVGPVNDAGIAGAIDVGEAWVYTTTYNASQTEIDAGNALVNTVTVATDETAGDTQSAQAETAVDATPEFVASKVVDQASIAAPGTLAYTITIQNTGNVTLTGLTPVDTLPDGGTGSLIGPVNDTGVSAALDVGETWTYNLNYEVSQAQIDAGNTLTNEVSVTSAETGPSAITASAETEIVNEPGLIVDKIVDLAAVNAPGPLSYTITVRNTGNTTLTNPVVTDVLPDGSSGTLIGPAGDVGISGAIDVGETWQYTVAYNVTQAEIDASNDLLNRVTITTDQTPVEQFATATTSVANAPSLAVSKEVDLAVVNAPSTLSYAIEVTNTGNVSLTGLSLIDSLPDASSGILTGPLGDIGLSGVLDVGETWQYTAVYSVSQAEVDAGVALTNTVVVTSNQTPQPVSDTAITTVDRIPEFTIEKVVDQTAITEPGLLSYTITMVNTGNVSLSGISINDTLPDASAAVLTGPAGDLSQPGVIDVGEIWTWTTTYNASQSDIDSGQALINSVSVSTLEAGNGSDTATTNVSQAPELSLAKTTSTTDYSVIGDVIDYTLTVNNVGNVVLASIVIDDPLADAGSIQCPADVLQPGGQMECTAVHTVVAADIQATQVDNQASVTSLDPSGNEVAADSEVVSVPMNRIPPIATDNQFVSPVSAVPVTLAAASDDSDANGDLVPATLSLIDAAATDTDGDGDFDSLVVPGEGTWLVDANGSVTFTPIAGFTSDPAPVSYTISDATALVSNEAVLSIDYPQSAPVAKNDLKVNPDVPAPTNPTTLNLLADNGSGVDSDPENDLSVQTINLEHADAVDTDNDGDADSLQVEGEGVWVLDNATGDITFTPEPGFLADPTPIAYRVSDINGLVSNVATITIDYPQTAPVAVDDQLLDQMLGSAVTLTALANDSDPENNIDPATLALIDPSSGASVASLVVAGEGTWLVDGASGNVTFTPEQGFLGDPTPVQYTVTDTTGLQSNVATLTITYEEPASLSGVVWLDADRDGQVGADEDRKPGWTLVVLDTDGNEVASTITDENGEYLITGLVPASYTVQFFNENGVFMDSQETDGPLLAGQTANLPLPVDPSGVVYDSVTRLPVAEVMLNLLNSSGDLVDPVCLGSNQQGQVTTADGLYAFDILPTAHPTCPASDVYFIELAGVPETHHPNYSSIIRQQGAASCGGPLLGCAVSAVFDSDSAESSCTVDTLPGTGACEVQAQADPPQGLEDTRYYVEFEISSGDQNVIFNHLPLDARNNDAEILLSKSVDKREISVGGLLSYTLTAENTKDVPAVDVVIVDLPPAGFVFEPSSVRLHRAGVDGELDTNDDVVTEHAINSFSANTRQTEFDAIDFEPEETLRITYVMKVGTGVVEGNYVNTASASGPLGLASNTVTASVRVVADPVLQQATLVGKVFDDRDSDGLQDPAGATGVKLKSEFYGWNSLQLPNLPGRRSINDDPKDASVSVNMPLTEGSSFRIETAEGTRIDVDESGNITETHTGAKARGLNAQDIRVCTREANAWPTNAEGFLDNSQGQKPVLEIVISNHGIDERGLPGVRLATVTGLIVETDAYGRYSIPDVDAGSDGSGRNFILKVDPATLPAGSEFTTENPYVLRVINNGLNKINFGIKTSHTRVDRYAIANDPCVVEGAAPPEEVEIEVSLGSIFFDTDSAKVREDQEGIVADIIAKLRQYGGGAIVIEANTDSRASARYNLELAEQRAQSIRERLLSALGESLMAEVTIEVDPAALTELEQ